MWKLIELIPPTTIFMNDNIMNIASSYLLMGEKNVILVDPGADIVYPLLKMKLGRLGIERDRVRYIILTHMHSDHFFNVVYFPRAKIVVSKKCVDSWRESLRRTFVEETAERFYELIFATHDITYIDSGGNLFDGIEIISTNLYQPGHLILIVNTHRGKEAITGDALLLPYWDAYRLLTGEISVRNEELRNLFRYLIERVDIIHQGHMPPIYVRELIEYIAQTKKK